MHLHDRPIVRTRPDGLPVSLLNCSQGSNTVNADRPPPRRLLSAHGGRRPLSERYDVVLGAGLAGLTAAYTLQQGGESRLDRAREGDRAGRPRAHGRRGRLPVRLRAAHPVHERRRDGGAHPRPARRQHAGSGAAGVHLPRRSTTCTRASRSRRTCTAFRWSSCTTASSGSSRRSRRAPATASRRETTRSGCGRCSATGSPTG